MLVRLLVPSFHQGRRTTLAVLAIQTLIMTSVQDVNRFIFRAPLESPGWVKISPHAIVVGHIPLCKPAAPCIVFSARLIAVTMQTIPEMETCATYYQFELISPYQLNLSDIKKSPQSLGLSSETDYIATDVYIFFLDKGNEDHPAVDWEEAWSSQKVIFN